MTNVRVCNAWKDVMGEMFLNIPLRLIYAKNTMAVIKSAALGMELSYKKQIIVEK